MFSKINDKYILLYFFHITRFILDSEYLRMKSNTYYNNVYQLISEDFNSGQAHEVIREWRSHNIYALDIASKLLERIVKNLDLKNCYTGQRLKRLVSIKQKLVKSEGMRLTKMQDIVGVRLVVNDLKELAKVVKLLQDGKILGRNISIVREFNYIKKPKEDGYRSYHITFEIKNKHRGIEYKRLFELQVRTKSQHAWSTVVETIGTYMGVNFKGGDGEKDWKSFFKESSYIFSWFEKFESGRKHLTIGDAEEVIRGSIRLKEIMLELKITELLVLLNNMTSDISYKLNETSKNDYAIIFIDYIKKESVVRTYPKAASKTVNNLYIRLEEELNYTDQIQVLFVEITNLTNLRKAFPNFYIDVSEFIIILKRYFNRLNDYASNLS